MPEPKVTETSLTPLFDEVERLRAIEERDEREHGYVCGECGHNAVEHYDNYNRCAFEWREGDTYPICECRKSRQDVVTDGLHTLLEGDGMNRNDKVATKDHCICDSRRIETDDCRCPDCGKSLELRPARGEEYNRG